MKKIYRSLLAVGVATSLGVGYEVTHSNHERITALSCDPLESANFLSKAPPRIEALRKMPWVVTSNTVGNLAVTYFRDCGIEVRGPQTSRYPLGALLMSTMCDHDGQVISIFDDPKNENEMLAPGDKIPSQIISEAEALKTSLLNSPNCKDLKVTVIDQTATVLV